jgi:hypothetical protein
VARDQADLLASPAGRVELVPAPQLTRHGPRALRDRCEGHDLLVLGAGAAARAAVEHAPIPVLVARWGAIDTKVTDTILVPVEDSPESSRAVKLAGQPRRSTAARSPSSGRPRATPRFSGRSPRALAYSSAPPAPRRAS